MHFSFGIQNNDKAACVHLCVCVCVCVCVFPPLQLINKFTNSEETLYENYAFREQASTVLCN